MKHTFLALVGVLVLAISGGCIASDNIALRSVTVDTFMQGTIIGNIDVPLLVPAEYEPVKLKNANFGYSYWMRPEDATVANTNGQLSEKNGYMYGKLSPNVGYDPTRDLFIGVEEPEFIAKAKAQFSSVVNERYRYGNRAILLSSIVSQDKTKFVYSMYVATNIDTNVVYIALRPPGGSQEIGDKIWKQVKTMLQKDK